MEIRSGSGEGLETEALRHFLDRVFGFEGVTKGFAQIYPQMYRPGAHPEKQNRILTEDGQLAAAVGSYPRTLIVGDESLQLTGIGNVGVRPESLGRGYMKRLMAESTEEMIRDGADLSDLSGQRQRYQYFGYETAGVPVSFRVTPKNTEHFFRGKEKRPLVFLPLKEGEREDLWDRAFALYEKKLCRIRRSREEFPLILRSHGREPFAVLENGRFLGYFTGELGELTLKDPADLCEVVRHYTEEHGEVIFPMAPWEKALLREAASICEEALLSSRAKISVFHYRKTVGAFLKLKSRLEKLADGRMTLLIRGIAGEEKLRISVREGRPLVEEASEEEKTDAELGHGEAARFFFGIYSPEREALPLARDWFPLPFAVERADHV